MKLKRNLVGVAGLLGAAIGAQAAMVTTMNWQFDTSDNAALATFTANPLNTAATASMAVGSGEGHVAGVPFEDASAYGNKTGIWNVGGEGSNFKLDLAAYNATSGATLNYSLSLVTFYSANSVGFLPTDPATTYQFTGLTLGTPTHSLIAGSGGSEGAWYTDTWNFSVTPNNSSTLSLQFAPVGTISLLVDRIDWSVNGDLAPVPEPALTAGLTAVGLVAFGWYRRSRKTA